MDIMNADQQAASDMFDEFMSNPDINEMGLVGPPGCGKSWLVKRLIDLQNNKQKIMNHLLDENNQLSVYLTATSNESAILIGEVCGLKATTIYSMLGLRVMDDWKTGDTYLQKTKDYAYRHNSLVVVDEAGWVDYPLLKILRETLKNCKVLFVYDHKQLTGFNSVTKKSSPCAVHEEVPFCAHLSINERNANPIGALAKQFRDAVGTGIFPKIEPVEDYIEFINDERFEELIHQEYVDNRSNSKILCWSNDMVNAYNNFIRNKIYHYQEFSPNEILITNKPVVQNGIVVYSTSQRVVVKEVLQQASLYNIEGYWIRTTKDIELFIPYDTDRVSYLLALAQQKGKKEGDWAEYFRLKNNVTDLRPLYASTVYKIQGRTVDNVFIDLNNIGSNPVAEEVLRQLHVAISRPRKKLYLYGSLPPKYRG